MLRSGAVQQVRKTGMRTTVMIAISMVGLALGVILYYYYWSGSIPKRDQGKLRLFILAGQSNMSGRGAISESETYPNVYVFGNDYHWKPAKEPVDDPINQIDKVSEDLTAGFSPSLPFAIALREQKPEMVIGLIPCAKGKSSIYQWRKSTDDNTLYGSCMKRVRAASAMGEVAGLIIFQGESDALDPVKYAEFTPMANEWAHEFETLIGDWRSDLGLPGLPVVFAEIGTNTMPAMFSNWTVVQQQQHAVRLPFSAMITTRDLALKDMVHFTTDSYRIIGKRFADAYLRLIQEQQSANTASQSSH